MMCWRGQMGKKAEEGAGQNTIREGAESQED